MKSKSIKILLMGAAITSMLSSCGDSWFEREPKNRSEERRVGKEC